MKKFAMLLMALSMFTLGCNGSTGTKKADDKAKPGVDKPADTPAEKPADAAK